MDVGPARDYSKANSTKRFTPAMNAKVTLSSKNQVVIPRAAREALGLSAGDELLVLCKPDRVVMIPKPANFTRRLARLHGEVWSGAAAYLEDEREAW